jgi:lipopolysaccharide assembly protein A
MSILHRTRGAPTEPAGTPQSPADPSTTPTINPVPRTRTGAVWIGVCTAALAVVVLIIFMVQNTRSVEVTFLWMHGAVPLSLALLIASAGAAILTMVFGVARSTQLRRLPRRQHR